jgi:hypothetical protein
MCCRSTIVWMAHGAAGIRRRAVRFRASLSATDLEHLSDVEILQLHQRQRRYFRVRARVLKITHQPIRPDPSNILLLGKERNVGNLENLPNLPWITLDWGNSEMGTKLGIN